MGIELGTRDNFGQLLWTQSEHKNLFAKLTRNELQSVATNGRYHDTTLTSWIKFQPSNAFAHYSLWFKSSELSAAPIRSKIPGECFCQNQIHFKPPLKRISQLIGPTSSKSNRLRFHFHQLIDSSRINRNILSMALHFKLLAQRPLLLRIDVLPFLILYGLLILWYNTLEEEPPIDTNPLIDKIKKQTFEGVEEVPDEIVIESMDWIYIKVSFVAIVFLHSLAYMSTHWSTSVNAFIAYSAASVSCQNIPHYRFAQVTYVKNTQYYSQIVPITRENELYALTFMENKYLFDAEKAQFTRLKPDTKFDLSTHRYAQLQPQICFGKNSLLIPMKKFKEVLREQLMEPFSFFQLFSISLWLLDESRFYALFTIMMLLVSACTVVIQRMKTMLTLRQMKLNPAFITVHRNGTWTKISTEDLLPGDICILQTGEQCKPVSTTSNAAQEERFLREQIPFSASLPPKLFKVENMNVDSHRSVPCDMLLLNGQVVVNESMLTGESVPQIKDSVEHIKHSEILDIKARHKSSVLYCGTEILQIQGNRNFPPGIKDQNPHCLALVLRTGFDTAKGKLIKTVFYNNENTTINKDGLFIVGILLIFALISSAYVLVNGLEDQERNKNKLFLRCIIIVTTVVPPELPMILSIAVNQSLASLQLRKIFCTEPYKIPVAGRVEVLAFDKTGTLTNDTLLFTGLVDSTQKKLKTRSEADLLSQAVLAGCQQLIYADNKLQGDPIELLFFQDNPQWTYQAQQKYALHKPTQTYIYQRHTFQFKSDLKRMSTIVSVEDKSSKQLKLLVKGAPEALEPLFDEIPKDFQEAYQHYANQGYRVLCLADRILQAESDIREELERNLVFRGLLICESPLKKDTLKWMQKFKQSYFDPIIITGDNMLTAIAVGRQLQLSPGEHAFILQHKRDQYFLEQHGSNLLQPIKLQELERVARDAMICLPSGTLVKLEEDQQLKYLVHCIIFARMSPKQKELIVSTFKQQGKGVLMCGDGTNDVGALKKAHVGIALVTNQNQDKDEEEDEEKEEQMVNLSFTQQLQQMKKQQEEMRRKMQEAQGDREKMKNIASQSLSENAGSLFDLGPSYKFGDACIAAPFTSKMSTSIRCVHTIVKQGVCTLVTTIQTYKIMALQSLLGAYSLSALHMASLKMSETQLTITSILGAGYYFAYSSAKPQRNLAKVKPSFSIFEFSFFASLILQVALHLWSMDYAINKIALPHMSKAELEINNDLEFKPTFLNTVVFLMQLLQQSCVFLFNHPGEPHMKKLDTSSKFFKSLFIPLVLCVVCAFNYSEDLNFYFELTFPPGLDASYDLVQLCVFVIVANFVIEKGIKTLKYRQWFGFI